MSPLRISITFVFAAAMSAGAAAQTRPDARTAKVDEIFKVYSTPDSPGCAVGVYKDGAVLYTGAYGMANLDHDVPLTPRSIFHVASVSKQFTAAAILLLAQDGTLSLDDAVQKHVPELADFGKPVTIRHLIHHTSGIRDQWTLLGLAGWRYSRDLISDDDVLYLLSRQRDLNFPPGERHLYSNSGYTLLAVIVSRVSGKTFREFTTERIFEPLGMTSTFFRDNFNAIVKHQAYGYAPAANGFRLSVTNFDTAGATSLMTTVEDLAKWNANFEKPVVGGTRLIAAMLERGVLRDGTAISYASGLTHGTRDGLPTIAHGGSDAGYRSAFLRFPDQRFGVATLCNVANANPTMLANSVASVYLGHLMTPDTRAPASSERQAAPGGPSARSSGPPAFSVSPEQLEEFAGAYRSEELDVVYRLTFEGTALTLERLKNRAAQLRPTAADTFASPAGTLRFTRDAEGRIDGFRLEAGRVQGLKFSKEAVR
jgi:CubicO group peptidase (beta-lactamase class C family)